MSAIMIFFFVPVVVVVLLGLNILLAPHKPDFEKVTAYECGFAVLEGQTRAPFNIAYYLVGILFLIFDLEIAVFYPLAVTLYQVGSYGFWIGMLFLALLTLGFVYELSQGVLYFNDKRNSMARPLPEWTTRSVI